MRLLNMVCLALLLVALSSGLISASTSAQVISTGSPYLVVPTALDRELVETQKANYPDQDGKELTDGVLAPGGSGFTHEAWQGWAKQDRHIVTVDLQEVCMVTEVSGRFFNFPGAGIYFPEKISVSTSLDGENWEEPQTAMNKFVINSNIGASREIGLELEEPVRARFVQLEVYVNDWCFIDEVFVKGERLSEVSADQVIGLEEIVSRRLGLLGDDSKVGWPQPGTSKVGSARHIALMFFGGLVPDSRQLRSIDFLPYVGYVDQNFQVTDAFFDTFLLLPASIRYYGAEGRDFDNAPNPSIQEDWELYLDQLYKPGFQLDALNSAVQTVNEMTFGDIKAKVIIGIPYPSPRLNSFGKLPGESKSLNFAGITTGDGNRFLAVKWFVEEVLTRWEEAELPNLELIGFYWYQEDIESRNSPEIFDPVIKNTADLLHEKGLYFYWIPYYQARGFRNWQDLGFDVAMMQPNFSFSGLDLSEAEYRLTQAAELASRYGLGLQMELHPDLQNRSMREKYLAYLEYGTKLGYQNNSVICYYQGVDDFAKAAFSVDPEIRYLYDATYKFVKGEQIGD